MILCEGLPLFINNSMDVLLRTVFFVVRHNPDRILLEFVRHFFTKPEILALMKRACSGEINPGITKAAFFDILIPLPEPDEQRRILKRISIILDKRQQLHEAITRLDNQIESQMRTSIPEVIANYDDIKIRRAEFIGAVQLSLVDN